MATAKYVYIGKFEQTTNEMVYGSPVVDMKLPKLDVQIGVWKVWVYKDAQNVFDLIALYCPGEINDRVKSFSTYVEAYNKMANRMPEWESTATTNSENNVVMLYDMKNLMTDESWCRAYCDVAAKYGAMTVKSGVLSKTFSDKTIFEIETFKHNDKTCGVKIHFN